MQPFGEVATLAPGGKRHTFSKVPSIVPLHRNYIRALTSENVRSTVNLYLNFGGKTRAAKFDIVTDKGSYPVVLTPPAGIHSQKYPL